MKLSILFNNDAYARKISYSIAPLTINFTFKELTKVIDEKFLIFILH